MSVAALRETSRLIQEAVLAAADPRLAVAGALAPAPKGFIAHGVFQAVPGRLFLLAVGKASGGMMKAALEALGPAAGVPPREAPAALREAHGLVVMPHGYSAGETDPRVTVRFAGHPVPDEGSLAAAKEAVRLVESMDESDVCLLLLSGGGSSLLSLPYPPLALADLVQTGRLLIASGADIHQVNTVRRHLGAVGGGRLAERCRGTLVTLAVSDVVGDDLHAIASGPTVADPTTFADAAAVLETFALLPRVPPAVRALIQEGAAGAVPETPKQLPARHRSMVIAGSAVLIQAASKAALARGFAAHVVTSRLTGEAREAGRALARAGLDCLRERRPLAPPACLMAAGETTVTVTGQGRGGRNQEIALSAAMELDGVPGILLTSFATDGKEGNTDAAGARASGETLAAGRAAGLDARACLAANDSHAFLSAAGELIVTGPTGTNVNDVTWVLVEGRGEERFAPIYSGKAAQYHELVVREDVEGNLPAALRDIVDFTGKTVVELGAGTGRVTKLIAPLAAKVLAFDQARHMLDQASSWLAPELTRNVTLTQADNRSIPLPDASADIVIEGWSFGYTVNRTPEGWRAGAVALLTETLRLLKAGGTAILIETLGTGQRAPAAPGTNLPVFYTWLENELGFRRQWIRTDYLFESLEKARELVGFFFGSMVDHEILDSGNVRVPECTGIWWKRKETERWG